MKIKSFALFLFILELILSIPIIDNSARAMEPQGSQQKIKFNKFNSKPSNSSSCSFESKTSQPLLVPVSSLLPAAALVRLPQDSYQRGLLYFDSGYYDSAIDEMYRVVKESKKLKDGTWPSLYIGLAYFEKAKQALDEDEKNQFWNLGKAYLELSVLEGSAIAKRFLGAELQSSEPERAIRLLNEAEVYENGERAIADPIARRIGKPYVKLGNTLRLNFIILAIADGGLQDSTRRRNGLNKLISGLSPAHTREVLGEIAAAAEYVLSVYQQHGVYTFRNSNGILDNNIDINRYEKIYKEFGKYVLPEQRNRINEAAMLFVKKFQKRR